MRACEGCRKRKIKCDAATTNTWPCSACIRLKLHCVKPNGYEGSDTGSSYDTIVTPSGQFQHLGLQDSSKTMTEVYAPQSTYSDSDAGGFNQVTYDTAQSQHNLHYTTVPSAPVLDPAYNAQNAFPTPPVQQLSRQDSSPDAQSIDSYQQQDLADLLGGLKVNELGTGRIILQYVMGH